MASSPLVNRYAQAVFDLAAEQTAQDRVVEELGALERLWRESRELRACLRDPFLPGARKQAVVGALFGQRLHPLTLDFLRLLIEKKRAPLLAEIARRTGELLRQRRGILPVRLTSARRLTPEQTAAIRARLARIFRRQVELETAVEAGLLGGIMIEAEYRLIDGSCRGQLDKIQSALALN